MSITKQENSLFAEWEEKSEEYKEYFVRDGVAYEDDYLVSKPKVVFVCKEYARSPDTSKKFDLRKNELVDANHTWGKVARILHDIQMSELPRARRCEYDKRDGMPPGICAFNLNKKGGGSKTNMEMLALVAMKDAKLICRQFAIYDPDVTLCAGTFNIFRFVCGDESRALKEVDGMHWYERSPGKFVLAINHFADRWRQRPEEVVNAVKKLRRKMKGRQRLVR